MTGTSVQSARMRGACMIADALPLSRDNFGKTTSRTLQTKLLDFRRDRLANADLVHNAFQLSTPFLLIDTPRMST